jgi:hypothetical protein
LDNRAVSLIESVEISLMPIGEVIIIGGVVVVRRPLWRRRGSTEEGSFSRIV